MIRFTERLYFGIYGSTCTGSTREESTLQASMEVRIKDDYVEKHVLKKPESVGGRMVKPRANLAQSL